jgi:hypothetical protein
MEAGWFTMLSGNRSRDSSAGQARLRPHLVAADITGDVAGRKAGSIAASY